MPNDSSTPLDPSAASAALQRLDTRLKALDPERLVTPRVDPKLAAMAALGVADKLAAPEVRARFARLPKEELDHAHLDDLRDAAWAAWHAKSQVDAALAAPGETSLPAAAVEAGLQLKERMIRVLRYYFETDADIVKALAPLGRRKTNAELPQDLAKLAKLYRERKGVIEADKMHYRAGDADEADAIAAQSTQANAARRAGIEGRGQELVSRTFTLLLQIYEEIRAAGLYLFRRENASELFPSLTSLPSPRGRPRKSAAGAPADAAAPSTDAPPSDPPPPSEMAADLPGRPPSAPAAKQASPAETARPQ